MKTIINETKHLSLLSASVFSVPMLTGIITDNYQLAEVSAVFVLTGLVTSYVCHVSNLVISGK